MTNTVLVIDDDQEILTYTAKLLRAENFAVKTATTGAQGADLAQKIHPNLVLLDLTLPDITGESLCRQFKKDYPDMQVIMFTARGGAGDVAQGLNMGADDYVGKPFAPEELVARINARLRVSSQGENILKIADLVVDPQRITVKRGGEEIGLTASEFKLLVYLMSNPGIVLTRDMILNHVWMYEPDVETRVVDVYVGYLRKKIDEGREPKLIHSVRGFGYTIKEPQLS